MKIQSTVLFCTGVSGSGKSYFIKNILPSGAFYNLRSATTRPMREGEKDGREYFFRDEEYFENETFATKLFVNERFWQPGQPKWLYGVPEFEIMDNWTRNFTYDVIEPRYVRQMIDWFKQHDIAGAYNFRVLYFVPPKKELETARTRQNMPNDLDVRRANTCNKDDFKAAKIRINHRIICNPSRVSYDEKLSEFLKSLTR